MTTMMAGEQPLPGEAAAIQQIVETMTRMLERDCPAGTLARRAAHAKSTGFVRAEFTVGEVAPDLRHGLFANPRRFDAWIRFSNSSPQVQNDRKRDVRGMAVKLLDVPGEKLLSDERSATTHDFVMTNGKAFFLSNPIEFAEFIRCAEAGRPFAYFFGWNPLKWRLRQLNIVRTCLVRTENVLASSYWSQTPYRLGPHIVKFCALPVETAPPRSSPADLFSALSDTLSAGDATFRFCVQRQGDSRTNPTEDPSIEWDEQIAPLQAVATIRIPQQTPASLPALDLAEQFSFSPWHALPAHEPLGGINRARRVVYEQLSKARHQMNGVVSTEPSNMESR